MPSTWAGSVQTTSAGPDSRQAAEDLLRSPIRSCWMGGFEAASHINEHVAEAAQEMGVQVLWTLCHHGCHEDIILLQEFVDLLANGRMLLPDQHMATYTSCAFRVSPLPASSKSLGIEFRLQALVLVQERFILPFEDLKVL